ncbi:MAG: rhamnulokinase family protein [Promethearchaeota archaeon]
MKEDYIAIDLGAESGRVILGTLTSTNDELPHLTLQEIHRFQTKSTYIFDSCRWNLIRFWEEIKLGLTKLSTLNNLNLRGIGVDAWGVNLVYLTNDNELAALPFHYRDNLIYVGDEKLRKELNMKDVFSITGIQEMPINGLVHLYGVATEYPGILERTAKIVMVPDYFNYLLTGTLVTEYTNATTSQIFDIRKHEFSTRLLEPLKMNPSVFPKTVQPGSFIGTLNNSVQSECNLGDIPIYAVASHDTASAVLGVPAEEDNWAYLSSGTWSLLGVEISEPIINEDIRKNNFTNEGGAFNTIRLLKNIMGLWLIQRTKEIWDAEAKKEGKIITYEHLTVEASQEESNRSIINVDAPEFLNPKNMVLTIQKYCKENNQPVPKTRGQITRCILDSLALKYKEVLQTLENILSKKIEKLHIVGGGSQNQLLNQITADYLRIPVLAGPIEATAIGNILMQAFATGSISDLANLRSVVLNSFPITKYEPKKKIYLQ